jgi:hypothetical protein
VTTSCGPTSRIGLKILNMMGFLSSSSVTTVSIGAQPCVGARKVEG